ncbi:MAG: hypothetical protein ACJAS4_003833 [Bacteriovoracaceae bacterium]|jgi:hypothetical protein
MLKGFKMKKILIGLTILASMSVFAHSEIEKKVLICGEEFSRNETCMLTEGDIGCLKITGMPMYQVTDYPDLVSEVKICKYEEGIGMITTLLDGSTYGSTLPKGYPYSLGY